MIEPDQLILGDCIEKMQEIPDKSCDMICTDLPFGQLNKSNRGAAWDVELPLEQLWEQWLRIAKEDAPIILFGNGMFTAKLMMSQPKLWRYNLIWDKVLPVGFLNANRMPMRSHEDIAVFYRKLPVYHPQMIKVGLHNKNHSRGAKYKSATNNCYGSFKTLPSVVTDEKYPKSIIRFSAANRECKKLHPSAKPVELLRWLIRTYSDEGDIILDCCAGSSTTAIAAIREKRHWICIEKSEKFYEIGKKRIEEEMRNPSLF